MPRHPAEITYYDEIGVAPNATQEEIRDSFRALVRIIHPDHQTDPVLKDIAERQMRKLNRTYSVLSDPEKRRSYDEEVEDKGRGATIIMSPNSNVNVRRLMERLAWVAAFIVLVIALIWLSSDNQAAGPPQISDRSPRKNAGNTVPATTTSSSELAQLRSDVRLLTMERDAAVGELARLRGAPTRSYAPRMLPEPAPMAALPPASTITELPSPSQQTAPAPTSAALARTAAQKPIASAASPARPFAGFWFYTRPATAQRGKPSSLYPPEFIETTISEQNGVVRGKYRSRYKIVDRAISPDVTFEFSGTANGSTVVCPWTGPGGSRGELTLKMAGDNAMMVDWTATELGSIQGLTTGTATLIRRID